MNYNNTKVTFNFFLFHFKKLRKLKAKNINVTQLVVQD